MIPRPIYLDISDIYVGSSATTLEFAVEHEMTITIFSFVGDEPVLISDKPILTYFFAESTSDNLPDYRVAGSGPTAHRLSLGQFEKICRERQISGLSISLEKRQPGGK